MELHDLLHKLDLTPSEVAVGVAVALACLAALIEFATAVGAAP